MAASLISIVANTIVEEHERNIGKLHKVTISKFLKAWIEGFAIFVAVVVCSCVTAVNDLQKEKQFRKLKQMAGAKKEVKFLVFKDLLKINR